MNCQNCGQPIQDGAAFCPNCGATANNFSQQQPNFTQNAQQYPPQYQQPYQPPYQPPMGNPYNPQPQQYGLPFQQPVPLGNYLAVLNFAEKAKTVKVLGIVATVLMFGIGFIFSIVIWIMSSSLSEPMADPSNISEFAILQKAKKDLALGKKLAWAPPIAFVVCFIFGMFFEMLGI